MTKFIDLQGHRFGRLVVQERQIGKWRCLCDCGNESFVRSWDLKTGGTQSCGCLKKERLSNRQKNRCDARVLAKIKALLEEKKSYKEIAFSLGSGWQPHNVKYIANREGYSTRLTFKSHKTWNISIEEAVKLRSEGKSCAKVARIAGVSRARIHQVCKESDNATA